MNLKYCFILILCLYLKGGAQKIKPLTVGDTMPGIEIKNILNYPALQSNFSAFKNDLVILDFLATTCLGCIEALPRLDSLQKEYGNKIHIILVSDEKKERVANFLQKNVLGRQCHLPIITADNIFGKFFPHTFIPHEVWIKNNVVKAFTKSGYVKKKNIQQVLDGEAINWPVKNDMPPYDYSNSLLPADRQHNFNFIVTPHIKDAAYKYTLLTDTVGKSVRTRIFNLPVISLYLRSYGLESFPASFIALDVTDTIHFIYDKNNKEWGRLYTYCYENLLPLHTSKKTIGESIRNDLNNYFGLKGRMEKRKILCNVLVKNVAAHASYSAGNYSVTSLLTSLNSRNFKTPYINESGYTGKVPVELSVNNLYDEQTLKEALLRQGIAIIPAQREVTVFVLTEK